MNTKPSVFVVDDDEGVRKSLCLMLETAGLPCHAYESAEHFLEHYPPGAPGCLILDVNMPGLKGPELQQELNRRKIRLPIIFLTAHGDIPTTVQAMKDGAFDFLTKPAVSKELINRVREALAMNDNQEGAKREQDFLSRISRLSEREKNILPLVLAGIQNKEIAQQLGISHRTVEIHRINILKKTGYHNFVELARWYEAYRHLLIRPFNV
jgi:FixJ family two-component response regulator